MNEETFNRVLNQVRPHTYKLVEIEYAEHLANAITHSVMYEIVRKENDIKYYQDVIRELKAELKLKTSYTLR